MISYNPNDFNLQKIEVINAEFNHLATTNSYYVYGLTQNNNPPIIITPTRDRKPNNVKLSQMEKWLAKHNIKVEIGDYDTRRKVKFGLRRDIREEPKYAAALIRTFVAFFEDVLKLKTSFKLPKIKLKPSREFVSNTYNEGAANDV